MQSMLRRMGRPANPAASHLGIKLRHKRNADRLSLSSLGSLIGVSKQALSQIENGTTKNLKGETLVKVAQYLEEDAANLIISKTPRKNRSMGIERGPSIKRNCPLIRWTQVLDWHRTKSMGAMTAFEDIEAWYPCPVECSPSTFVLRVRGASMEPRFHDGEHIFIDPAVPASKDKYVIAHIEGAEEPILRQVVLEGGRRYLRPSNPMWPEPIIEVGAKVNIIGVVVYQGRPV
jgi:SOS-response transcriptional repressor LexA